MKEMTEYTRFNEDIVKKCSEEISVSIGDRSAFLDNLICRRVNECNERYLKDFDKVSSNIIKSASNVSIGELSSMIKRLNKYSSSIYKYELILFSCID